METFIINTHGGVIPNTTIDRSILERFRNIYIITFAVYGRDMRTYKILPLMHGINRGGHGFIKALISTLLMRSDQELIQAPPPDIYDIYTVRGLGTANRSQNESTYMSHYADLVNAVTMVTGLENIAIFDKDSLIPDMQFSYSPGEADILISSLEADRYDIPIIFPINSYHTDNNPDIIQHREKIERWKEDHPRHIYPTIFTNKMTLNHGVYFYPDNPSISSNNPNMIPVRSFSRNTMFYDNILSESILSRSLSNNWTRLSEFINNLPTQYNDKDVVIFLPICRLNANGESIPYPYMYERPADVSLLDRLSSIMISDDDYVIRTPSMFSVENIPSTPSTRPYTRSVDRKSVV